MPDLTPARERLVRLIGEAGSLTLADLRGRTGLSRSTLREHLARLTQHGVVVQSRERRGTGRPPAVYRLTPRGALRASGTYLAFLHALLATLQARGQDTQPLLRDALAGWADRHTEIRTLPTLEERLEAARVLLFGDLQPSALRRTEEGFEFSLEGCPLGARALEYGDPCVVARAMIGTLVGEEVEQSEWISRGDPRCTFCVRTGAGAASPEPLRAPAAPSPPPPHPRAPLASPSPSPRSIAARHDAEEPPITFSFVGIPRDPALLRLAMGLRRAFERRGHRCQMMPEGDVRLVVNFIDPKKPRPFRRRGQGTFVVSVTVTEEPPEDVLRQAYPLLIRSLANLCIYLVREGERLETYFVTLEQGHYRVPDLDEEAYFEFLFQRLLPLASSELVINNEFHPDLPRELWQGDELTRQLAEAGRRLDALDLLPTPFPIQELLPPRDWRHVTRLFGLGGLSYGNLSVRRDATTFWMSASGVDKGKMETIGRDILLVKGFDPARRVMLLSVPPHVEPRRVSVDAIEHWMIYTEHPTVGAIVHVHAWMEGVPSTVMNYPCGTRQLAQAVADIVRQAPDPASAVVGLRNHGLTITGRTLGDIFDRLEAGFIRQVPMS